MISITKSHTFEIISKRLKQQKISIKIAKEQLTFFIAMKNHKEIKERTVLDTCL